MTTATVIHPLRLLPGQDLRAEIQRYVEANDIRAGWIVTCVGSLTDYNIRFANREGGTLERGHFEIVSLVGVISIHGSHLHISIGDNKGRIRGGHLMDGNIVYTTAEIIIGESKEYEFLREEDGSTPYRELQIRERKD